MPRKATTAIDDLADTPAPRRSSRIKEIPKPEPTVVKKAPVKPRAKKADKVKETKETAGEEKSKPARGKKRKADDDTDAEDGAARAPASKKVRYCFTYYLR